MHTVYSVILHTDITMAFFTFQVSYFFFLVKYTVEPGYNDIGLYDTLPIPSDIVVPINSSLLIKAL